MTAIENYSRLIDNILGAGTTTFDTSKDIYNHVIGALNNPTEYNDFTANFISRLERLKTIYSTHPTYLTEIKVQVNEVASVKNWEGAFAELAAYDHLNSDILNHKTYIHNPIQPNITLPNIKSFALELGKSATNLDGYVEDRPLYFDVKCLKDNVTEILTGIYNDLKTHLGTNDIHITAEHELNISYDDFQKKRTQLLNELKAELNTITKKKILKSSVVSNLSYRILWGAGVLTAERSYHPFSHAKNYHKTIFNYANKFIKDEPTVIVLVVFPWYNLVISNFANSNVRFYRALARRVFCQYNHDTTKFKTFNTSFTGEHTIFEVSKHLSGIIFLEDNTILSKEPNKTNVKSFVYLNPNAVKPLTRSLASDFIMGLHNTEYDDFEYDNY
jgi:hypothetical protein